MSNPMLASYSVEDGLSEISIKYKHDYRKHLKGRDALGVYLTHVTCFIHSIHMTREQRVDNTVHELRKKAQVTQEELAEVLSVTRQTVIAIEKGNYAPSVVLALKIAHFFKVPVEEIFHIAYED